MIQSITAGQRVYKSVTENVTNITPDVFFCAIRQHKNTNVLSFHLKTYTEGVIENANKIATISVSGQSALIYNATI